MIIISLHDRLDGEQHIAVGDRSLRLQGSRPRLIHIFCCLFLRLGFDDNCMVPPKLAQSAP